MEPQNLQNCRVTRSYKVESSKQIASAQNDDYTNSLKAFLIKFNRNLAVCGAAAAAAIRN